MSAITVTSSWKGVSLANSAEETNSSLLRCFFPRPLKNYSQLKSVLFLAHLFSSRKLKTKRSLLRSFQVRFIASIFLYFFAEAAQEAIEKMKTLWEDVQATETQFGILSTDHDSAAPLRFGLCMVVFNWASGESFKDIMRMTDIQEGVIVRCIQVGSTSCCILESVFRDWKNSAEKFETALEQLATFQLPLKWNNAQRL